MIRLFWTVSVFVILLMVVPVTLLFFSLDRETLIDGIKDREVIGSVLLTVECGLVATLLGLLSGLPLSYILARSKSWVRKYIEPLIEVPIVIPPIVAGVALMYLFSGNTLLGKFLHALGISVLSSRLGIVVGMYFVGVPFIVKSTIAGFSGINEKYEKMAMSLGASPWRVFFTVTLPMNFRSIVNGSILMFGRSMGIFGTVFIIAYYPKTIPVMVYERYTATGLLTALPPALLLVVVSLLLFIMRQWLLGNDKR